jgi:RNA polymerase sigma factor (sigma-70 family)
LQRENTYDEPALLYRVAGGDERAFADLIRVYWKHVYAQALYWLRSAAEAEELTQDVFVRVWAAREKLEQVDRFDSWLFIVARNTILTGLRKKLKRPGFVAEQDVAENALRPDERMESRQHYECLMKGVSLLPEKRQQVFRLSRLEGLTHAQIAERLGMHKDTVAQYIVKAAAFLRGYLQEHLGDSLLVGLLLRLFF